MDQMKIGTLIKELRREKGITQEQLAEEFSVSRRTVSRWETGSNLPDLDVLIEMSDFFAIDLRELLDGERKDEEMNNEVMETAQKVSEYADVEKKSLLQKMKWISIVGLITLCIGMIMSRLSSDTALPIYDYAEGACFGFSLGALLVMILYTTGLLTRLQSRKDPQGATLKRVLIVICFAVIVIGTLVAVLTGGR
jgi:transcriptional regulator with XRE-family HTH domain